MFLFDTISIRVASILTNQTTTYYHSIYRFSVFDTLMFAIHAQVYKLWIVVKHTQKS